VGFHNHRLYPQIGKLHRIITKELVQQRGDSPSIVLGQSNVVRREDPSDSVQGVKQTLRTYPYFGMEQVVPMFHCCGAKQSLQGTAFCPEFAILRFLLN